MHSSSLLTTIVSGAVLLGLLGQPSEAGAVGADLSAVARIPSDLPVGVRIGYSKIVKVIRADLGLGRGGGEKGEEAILFADAQGRPFYSLPTGAECADACLKKFQPAAVPLGANAAGGFTIVNGNWSFQGKALYVALDGPKLGVPLRLEEKDALPSFGYINGMEVTEGKDGMKLLRVAPRTWTKMPFSIGVAEYRLAPGQVLVAGVSGVNPMGKPLYAFSGTPEQEKALPSMFKPQYAGAFSLPIGDFTVHMRSDGTPQWSYRGATLYTCSCDISLGSLNGEGVVPGMAPAMMVRYSVPKEVTLQKDPLVVGRMVEASTGKTLYFRDRLVDAYIHENMRPILGTISTEISATLGTKFCDAKCEREWKPFWAPKDAQPQGYWSVYDRADGKRQWAYKNAALYTHAKEAPGSVDGNETFIVEFENGHGGQALPKEFGLGVAWRALVP